MKSVFVILASSALDAVAVPFGEHSSSSYQGAIKAFEHGEFPPTARFYRLYANGLGQPVLFKGAAKNMSAMNWTDDLLISKAGSREIDVEKAKKETRRAPVSRMTLKKFLSKYNRSDIYTVTDVPAPLMHDVELLPFLCCGGYTKTLHMANLWMSSGGTYSVLHNDIQDNINCLFSGTKRIIFWSPEHRASIQSEDYGWHNYFEDPLDDGGYGSFGRFIDVQNVDLVKYPGWKHLDWWDGAMEAGDCLFIPHRWYHTVASHGRNIAVNTWWWRNDANGANIRGDVSPKPNAPFKGSNQHCKEGPFTLAECTWGFEHVPKGHSWRNFRSKEFTDCQKGGRGGSIQLEADQQDEL